MAGLRLTQVLGGEEVVAAPREAKQPYRYDVCKRGHDMRDPQNILVNMKGYQHCRTCKQEGARRRSAKKRAQRLRTANQVTARAKRLRLDERGLKLPKRSLGRQGDADRMLEVVRLRRDVRRLEASTKTYREEAGSLRTSVELLKVGMKAGDKLVGDLRMRIATLMGENATLHEQGRTKDWALLARGGAVGAVTVTAAVFGWFLG